jgi:hypothetical protein
MGRIVAWLTGSLLVLASTITGLNLLNPEPIDPGSPLATQTEDGQSRFSPAGMTFLERRGELFVKIGGESGPASALALPESGGHRIALDPPVDVHLLLPDGELVIQDVGRVEFFMRSNTVSSVELVYAGNDVGDAVRDAGFQPSSLGIREENGVRIGARLSNGELDITVRALD